MQIISDSRVKLGGYSACTAGVTSSSQTPTPVTDKVLLHPPVFSQINSGQLSAAGSNIVPTQGYTQNERYEMRINEISRKHAREIEREIDRKKARSKRRWCGI